MTSASREAKMSASAAKSLAERAAAHKPNVFVVLGKSAWPIALGIAFAFVMQQVVAPWASDFHGKLMLDVGIAILCGVALNIVNGYAGQFSIGHAGFMAVGGYVAAGIVYYGSIKLWGSRNIHGGFLGPGEMLLAFACVMGGIVAALTGVLVGLPSLRLRGDYLAIVTLGFGEIVRVLLQQTEDVVMDPKKVESMSALELSDNLGGALGFFGTPRYLDPKNPFWIWLFVVVVLIVAYRLKYSSKGRQLLAVRENEVAAEAVGVPTTRVKVTAFITSAFFAGIGGGLYAHELGNSLRPADLGFQKSIDLVIIVVLGGMGSTTGVVVAATALTILPEVFREFSEYRMIVYALALILMMILRPQGLFGIKELWELSAWRKLLRRGRPQ
jgi:branched-chain amino acid transport system permease protein